MKKLITAFVLAVIATAAVAEDQWTSKDYGNETVYLTRTMGSGLIIGARGVGVIGGGFIEAPAKVSIDGGAPVEYKTKTNDRSLLVLENSNALADKIRHAKTVEVAYGQCDFPMCKMTMYGEPKTMRWEFDETLGEKPFTK